MTLSRPVSLAQALIRCPSVTPLEAGALGVIEAAVKPLGFACERLVYEGDNGPRTENLFARLGENGPHFCFAGHADVVPAGHEQDWAFPPFAAEIDGDFLYGRGAEDMKGAIACFISAVEAFLAAGAPGGSISLLITCDEEGAAINGTKKVMEWMRAHGHVPDICVVGEPTNPTFIGEMAKIGRRGSLNAQLTVHGRQGHVAYPQLADNPVSKLIRILHALDSRTFDEGTEFFPPSNLEIVSVDVGNPADNVIPAQAHARFNIRFNPLHDSHALTAWLHETCRSYSTDYTLAVRVSGEAFLTPPGHHSELVQQAVQDVTGMTPALSTTGGTSDARFLHTLCPVVEFGATGITPHHVNERVKLDDLEVLTACYRRMLERFFA